MAIFKVQIMAENAESNKRFVNYLFPQLEEEDLQKLEKDETAYKLNFYPDLRGPGLKPLDVLRLESNFLLTAFTGFV